MTTTLNRKPTKQLHEAIVREATIVARQQIEDELKLNRFELRGANKEIQTNQDREVLLWGTARTGKSFAWLVKMHRLAVKYPKFRGLIVRKTRTSLSESALQTFEEQVLGTPHPLVANGPKRRFRDVYQYPNGAQIVVDGMDKKTKILSAEFDFIFVQEANECTVDDIEYLRTRLSNDGVPIGEGRYFHQLAMDSNPNHPKHWLKLRWESGITKSLQSKFEDNPRLYDAKTKDWTPFGKEYVFGTLAGLTGVRKDRFYRGLWVAAEGAIYDGFDETVHVINIDDILPGGIPQHWPRIRVIDFGYKNPFVCHWYAIDPNTRMMVLYREIYQTELLVEDAACLIKHLSGEYDHPAVLRWLQRKGITYRNERERIIDTICDHDAEDRATLDRYGIPNVAAFKGVSLGIQAVQTRLKIEEKSRTTQLYFVRDALVETDQRLAERKLPTQTIEEIPGYIWQKDKEGKPLKEQPVKIDDHGCDTLRYAVCYVDDIGSELNEETTSFIEEIDHDYQISPY